MNNKITNVIDDVTQDDVILMSAACFKKSFIKSLLRIKFSLLNVKK